MKVTQDDVVDRQAVLHVEVDEDRLEHHLQRAYQKLVQRTSIRGFRKGKTPRRIFEQMIGRSALVEEALETLVPDAVSAAIEQEEIEAYGTPRVSVIESEPIPKLDVTVPLQPSVTLGDYRSLDLEETPEEVTDEQIEQAIEQARQGQATWEPVERALQIDDLSVITVTGDADGESVLDGDNVEYLLSADSQTPLPGFAEQLVGLSAGQSKEFSLDIPADFPGEQVAGKTVACKAEVFEVKTRVLPEIDDDLARSVGQGYETIDEMRTGLREQFEETARLAAERRLQDRIIDSLLETSNFEIPPLIVDHEAEHVLYDQQQALARYQVSMQDYMQNAGKSGDELMEEARESAITRLKRTLVVEEVARAEDLEVSDEDVEAETERLMAAGGPQEELDQLRSDESQESIKSMLLRRKALEMLTEIVESKDGAPADKGEPSEDSPDEASDDGEPEEDT